LKIQTARQRLLASTIIGGAALLAMAAPAFAADDATEVEGVVVTGSRIVRQDFEAISPVTTVGSEQLELSGTLTVDTLLNELPQIVPGNTRTSNNSGGETFSTIDLRGLGPNRTLVLINGERVPSSSRTGVVDLNTIPASLIDRVEVVTGGASAVYGSDAISGVVNFILKNDYEGAEISATYGASFEGESPEVEVNALLGGNFANGRGNLTTYASYYNRQGAWQADFPTSRVQGAVCYNTSFTNAFVCDTAAEANASGGVVAVGGSGTPPWGWITNDGANPFQNLAALLPATFGAGHTDTNCDGIPGGAVNTGNLSFNDAGLLTPRYASAGCKVPDRAAGSSRYNYAPDNYLIIPAERFNITTTGTYDITDNIKAKVFLSYVNSAQEVQLAPTPATGLTVTLTPNMQALIKANAPDLWIALQSRPTPLAPFTMDRRMSEVGARHAWNDDQAFTLLTTVDGDFNDNWSWSVTASYGQTFDHTRSINSTNRTALSQGLAGCQTAAGAPLGASALPGCVPLDIFGPGTLTDAMVDFLSVTNFTDTNIDETRIAGFVRGDLFELPAGPVSSVFGAEYRETNLVFDVDNEQRTGNMYGFNAIQPSTGSVQVTELYAEVAVPLIKDQPLAYYLGLEAGYRYSDYSTVGSVATFKVGGEWAPVEWLRFRAMYNEATRAPSVIELFQAGDQGFPAYTEPCRQTAVASNPALQAFCISQGVPAAAYPGFVANNSQVQAFAFGNPNLTPETAKTFTGGLVFQPDWFPVGDFRATVDYYHIEITDVILPLGATYWIGQCYKAPYGGNPAACARIVRDHVTGQIYSVDTTVANAGVLGTSGIDFQFEWTTNLEDTFLPIPGRLRVNELFSLVQDNSLNGTNFIGTDGGAAIGGGIFDWKSTLSVYYTLGDWTAFARWSYVPSLCDTTFGVTGTASDCNGPFPVSGGVAQPAASYIDASLRWNITDNFQVTGVISNLFDERAPQTMGGAVGSGQGNTDPQLYEPGLLGRKFSISAKVRF